MINKITFDNITNLIDEYNLLSTIKWCYAYVDKKHCMFFDNGAWVSLTHRMIFSESTIDKLYEKLQGLISKEMNEINKTLEEESANKEKLKIKVYNFLAKTKVKE